jgi:hypothetical protein
MTECALSASQLSIGPAATNLNRITRLFRIAWQGSQCRQASGAETARRAGIRGFRPCSMAGRVAWAPLYSYVYIEGVVLVWPLAGPRHHVMSISNKRA